MMTESCTTPSSTSVACWSPAIGNIGEQISFDTETTPIQEGTTPAPVLATASNGTTAYLISRENIAAFIEAHVDATVFMHNAAFDIHVIEAWTHRSMDEQIRAGRIVDTGILYRLVGLAKNGQVPYKWSLAEAARQALSVTIEKGALLDDGRELRTSFGDYVRAGGTVDYESIPLDMLTYALKDAQVTYELGCALLAEAAELVRHHDADMGFGVLSHDIQLRASLALADIERRGMHVDMASHAEAVNGLSTTMQGLVEALKGYGYCPGKPGNLKAYNEIIKKIEASQGISLPSSPKRKMKTQKEEELQPYSHIPFIAAFIDYKHQEKVLSFLNNIGQELVRPHFNILVDTGRTSCRAPNLQNLPRKDGIRELFVPAPGHLLLAADYKCLELCTLAQVNYRRYGYSRMRDLLNDGVDLHLWFASQITGKKPEEVTKEERQLCKAANFGFPGGLGAERFLEHAKTGYGLDISLDQAKTLRDGWFKAFPEMEKYLYVDQVSQVLNRLDLNDAPAGLPPETAAMILLRIAGGAVETRRGRQFEGAELDWAWKKTAALLGTEEAFAGAIAARTGSRELQSAVIGPETVITLTGRVRSGTSYCEARNTPFQGLAADGAKLAAYELFRKGYRVVNFVHDEFLVELPFEADHTTEANRISEIMTSAMALVVPDVRIQVEVALMHRWTKKAQAVWEDGRLMPWTPGKEKEEKQCQQHGPNCIGSGGRCACLDCGTELKETPMTTNSKDIPALDLEKTIEALLIGEIPSNATLLYKELDGQDIDLPVECESPMVTAIQSVDNVEVLSSTQLESGEHKLEVEAEIDCLVDSSISKGDYYPLAEQYPSVSECNNHTVTAEIEVPLSVTLTLVLSGKKVVKAHITSICGAEASLRRGQDA